MGSDMVVALKDASANQTTLFAVNFHGNSNQRHLLVLNRGKTHDWGEIMPIAGVRIPQARQTFSVLGLQPAGQWGLMHGVNEKRVAIGVTEWQSRLRDGAPTLTGPDLARLALERSHSACHAVETLTDLLEHHGPSRADGLAPTKGDHIFLIADADEAFVLEVCGRWWALMECGHTRVVTDVAMIRQDWRRLAPGLGDAVIAKGWWRDDGSKVDFAGCVGDPCERARHAQKRWGRASLTMAQQHGAIDAHFLRRMMGDHYSANRDLLVSAKPATLVNSVVVELAKSPHPLLAWIAFGTPRVALHFPIVISGELPELFHDGPATIEAAMHDFEKLAHGKDEPRLDEALERLQTRFDQDADDFAAKSHHLAQSEQSASVAGLASDMMRHHAELFAAEHRRLLGREDKAAPPVKEEEEVLFFA